MWLCVHSNKTRGKHFSHGFERGWSKGEMYTSALLTVFHGRVWLLGWELFSLASLSAWQIRSVTPRDLAPDSDKHCKHSVKWLRQLWSHITKHTEPGVLLHWQMPPALLEWSECLCACGELESKCVSLGVSGVSLSVSSTGYLCVYTLVCTHACHFLFVVVMCFPSPLSATLPPTYHQSIDRYITLCAL